MDDIQIYTDGSGFAGNIGAAAVVMDPPIDLQHQLGDDETHTVFEGEPTGVLLVYRSLTSYPSHLLC